MTAKFLLEPSGLVRLMRTWKMHRSFSCSLVLTSWHQPIAMVSRCNAPWSATKPGRHGLFRSSCGLWIGQSAPFGRLQALPKDGLAVTSWANPDEAFADIARGIRSVAEELAQNP